MATSWNVGQGSGREGGQTASSASLSVSRTCHQERTELWVGGGGGGGWSEWKVASRHCTWVSGRGRLAGWVDLLSRRVCAQKVYTVRVRVT